MKVLGKVVNALSFAHLAGIMGGTRAETDDKEKKDDGERDHEDGDVKVEEPGDGDKNYPVQKDDESDEDFAQRCEDYEDEKDKKARADDDDAGANEDDDKEKEDREVEMRGSSPIAKARRREQTRCAAIFASPAAARNPVLAANLAFKTRMTRAEALAVLEGTPSAVSPNNAGRAGRNPNVGPGASRSPNSKQATDASLDAAFKRARNGH